MTDIDVKVMQKLKTKFICQPCKTRAEIEVRSDTTKQPNKEDVTSDSNSVKLAQNISANDIMKTLEAVRTEIRELRNDMKFYGEQYEEQRIKNLVFEETLKELKSENDKINKELKVLKELYLSKQQENRNSNLIIMGLKTEGNTEKEKDDNINSKVIKVLQYVDDGFDRNEIEIKRINPKKEDTPIVIKFKSIEQKERLTDMRKKKGQIDSTKCGLPGRRTNIYLNEDMSKEQQILFRSARGLREKGFKYVWTRYGRIYVKKGDTDSPIRVNSEEHVKELAQ